MTSLLAGTLDHGVRGSREVRESQGSQSISGNPRSLRNSPVVALTTISICIPYTYNPYICGLQTTDCHCIHRPTSRNEITT